MFAIEPTTDSPLFGLPDVVVTPHLGASTREAQDKAGTTVAEMVRLALRGEFVPYAVNVSAGAEVTEVVRPFVQLAERLGGLVAGLAEGGVRSVVAAISAGSPSTTHGSSRWRSSRASSAVRCTNPSRSSTRRCWRANGA